MSAKQEMSDSDNSLRNVVHCVERVGTQHFLSACGIHFLALPSGETSARASGYKEVMKSKIRRVERHDLR